MLDIQKTCKRRESLESIEDKHLQFEKNKINRADLKSAVQHKKTKQRRADPRSAKTRRSKQSYKDTKPHLVPSLEVAGV